MSILTFVQSLPVVTERRDVVKILDQLAVEYDDTVGPIVADMNEAFGKAQLNSNLAKRMDTVMRRYVNYTGGSLQLILSTLINLRGCFEIVRKDIRSTFSVSFTNTNLSFDKANVLKFIDAVAFYIRYARKYMLFLIASEAYLLNGKATPGKWAPAEQEWVEDNMDQFAGLYVAMSQPPAQFKSKLANASSAQIEAATFSLAQQSLSASKTDPLEMAGFSPQQNILMHIGKYIAELQVSRYNAAKEEYYGLQLRLQELRDIQSGQGTNPVIQKQIQAYEKRASEFEYDISRIEEKAGIK